MARQQAVSVKVQANTMALIHETRTKLQDEMGIDLSLSQTLAIIVLRDHAENTAAINASKTLHKRAAALIADKQMEMDV